MVVSSEQEELDRDPRHAINVLVSMKELNKDQRSLTIRGCAWTHAVVVKL